MEVTNPAPVAAERNTKNDLDEWLHYYNNDRTHQGKMCCGRTPMETLTDGKQIWKEKFIH